MSDTSNAKALFQAFLSAARQNDEFHVEKAKILFSDLVSSLMENQGVSNTELAERLNTSKQYISKVLNGHANVTISTMVKISRALNADFSISIHPSMNSSQARGENIHRVNGHAQYKTSSLHPQKSKAQNNGRKSQPSVGRAKQKSK
ncbi:MAG: helix-turn-helix domain-containing protein [bacterium]|nr:helix-turn-helix domain-containing protein [bacterium]